MPMDQIIAIRVFVLAVETGSLVAAGRELGVSAAMAGRYLRSLEERLGVRLLHRSTRRLHLTDAGQRYHERCKPLLAELDDASREAADHDLHLRGVLKVAAPVTFGALYLGQSVARYMDEFPGVTIDIGLSDRHLDLLQDGIDVAIRIGQLRNEGLVVRRLASCRMLACASPAYLETHGVPATPLELHKHACLGFGGAVSTGDWTFADAGGVEQRVDPDVRLRANNMDMLRAMALAGSGVVYGPGFVFGDALAAGHLIQVLPDYRTTSLPIHAVFPAARYIPRIVRSFVDGLARDFGGVPPWERWAAVSVALEAGTGKRTPRRSRPTR